MLGNCGGLISTWSYLPSDGPNYPIGEHPSCSSHPGVTDTAAIGNGINLGCTGAIFILL